MWEYHGSGRCIVSNMWNWDERKNLLTGICGNTVSFLFIDPRTKGNYIITENNVGKVCRHGPATSSESKGADHKVFWAIVHTICEIRSIKVNCGTSERYLLWAQRNWKWRLVPKCKKTILCLKKINNGYWALGPVWQEPEPSQATGMALICCILGKFLGVVCHCFPPLCLTNIYILPVEDNWEDGMCKATRPLWLSKTHEESDMPDWTHVWMFYRIRQDRQHMYNVTLGCVFT
jgi:hypothetical protein